MCACVFVYATLWGPNVSTRIVKPEMFDIMESSMRSPRGEKKDKKIVKDVYLKV